MFIKNAAIGNLQLRFKTQLKRSYTLAIAAFLKNTAIGPVEQFFKGGPIAVFLKNAAIANLQLRFKTQL